MTRRPNASRPLTFFGLFVSSPDRGQPEVGEDLVPDPALALVGREPEREVRVDGVHPLLLQLVRLQLVQQPDAASLLGHVQQHAAALGHDRAQRELELLAAVAAQRVEDVAGEAFRVDADEDVVHALDLPAYERDMLLAGEQLPERDRREVAVGGRQGTETTRSMSFSVRRRYWIRSATLISLIPCRSQ